MEAVFERTYAMVIRKKNFAKQDSAPMAAKTT
jgi:hypothetical protein